MACYCSPSVVGSTNIINCPDCIIVKSLRFTCSDGVGPCGEAISIDVSTYNDLEVCDGDYEYYIKSFDQEGFDGTPIIDNNGVITAVSSGESGKEYCITYGVKCNNSIHSSTANIYICHRNLCLGVICDDCEKCDQCDGICKPDCGDITIESDPEVESKPDLVIS